jgi:hypothetical protein
MISDVKPVVGTIYAPDVESPEDARLAVSVRTPSLIYALEVDGSTSTGHFATWYKKWL